MVAILPMFAAMHSARRKGTGFSPSRSVTPRTSGVKAMQTVSLINSAERPPERKTMAYNSIDDCVTCFITKVEAKGKKPERRRFATTIIRQNRTTMVR